MYCFGRDTDTVLIERLFGLKVCGAHKPNAIRDCKAYLHTNNMVRLEDAFKHPVVGKFLSVLQEMDTFKVERSDLSIQPGWRLRDDNSIMKPAFLQGANGRWLVPAMLGVYPNTIDKNVPIINFLNPDICAENTPEFRTLIEDTIDCLKEGIYKQEFEEFQKAKEQDRVGSIAELQGVAEIMYEGAPARIYIPQGQLLAPEPTDPSTDPSTVPD